MHSFKFKKIERAATTVIQILEIIFSIVKTNCCFLKFMAYFVILFDSNSYDCFFHSLAMK